MPKWRVEDSAQFTKPIQDADIARSRNDTPGPIAAFPGARLSRRHDRGHC